MRLALTVAAALALAAPALAQDAAPYVAVPGDGPVWGLALDAATREGPNLRLAFVLIDGEEPGVADLRGHFLVDCAQDRYRQLDVQAHDGAGNVLSEEPPAPDFRPLTGEFGRAIRESLCEGKPLPGRRYGLTELHELADGLLR
jgi:hypothetical protein